MLVGLFTLMMLVSLISPESKVVKDSSSELKQESLESVLVNARFECFDGICVSTGGHDCDTPADSCDTITY